jgi:short-subunit dehydrogenase
MNEHKTVVIAGASSGIGRTIALALSQRAYNLALISRNESDLQKVKLEILANSKDSIVTCHPVDLSDAVATEMTFKEIGKAHSNIFGLVNCAGFWVGGEKIKELTVNQMKNSFDHNFFAAFNPIKGFLNETSLPTSHKVILNLGATSSLQGWPEVGAFCAAKNALRSLSQTLAREYFNQGIHVCHVVIDGLLNNERTRLMNPDLAEDRFINMDDLAKTLLYLIEQPKSCWTFELDVRPFNEDW